nr:AAA family ATPase [Actinomycetota bacterium]
MSVRRQGQNGGLDATGEAPGRIRDEDRTTRKPMAWWDRIKLLVFLLGAWFLLLWSAMAQNPFLPFNDAVNLTLRSQGWLLFLAGVELLRQVHYFISERSARYHRFWTQKVFGSLDRRRSRMNDWNRYRLGRVLKWLFFLLIVDLIFARLSGLSPAVALVQLPIALFSALPFFFQIFITMFVLIAQFGALFWFLSRGGVDVYFPDDIKTRFSDVWGQDNVLHKVRENLLFLDNPEAIEKRGGYVPGGILLWGPPGTGKTLMAEAVAGETGKPYVFVDPGAFINMFMGVGILKVKGLFRKLRKLAVKYGGVIVFFDEADSLGNRGAMAQGGWGGGQMTTPSPWSSNPPCNGLSYISPDSAAMLLQSSLEASAVAEPRRGVRDRVMMMGGGGGGGMGTLQALLTELSGLKKPRGFFNRVVRRSLGLRPKPPPKYRMLVM